MARDAMAFFYGHCLWIASVHHSFTLRHVFQLEGSTSWRSSHCFILFQTRNVYLHLKRICEADSCTRLESLKFPQFGHPLLSSLSAVHTRFLMINHAKILHFGESQGFQTKKALRILCVQEIACYNPTWKSNIHHL
jgi:hypothetical protein